MRAFAAALLLCLPAHGALPESKAIKGVFIDDRGSPKERALLEKGLKLIARSPTARRLEERRGKLGPVVVGFLKLDFSSVTFSGPHGNTDIHGEIPRMNINEEVLRSTHAFVETLAHELYGHGILLREKVYDHADIGHTIYSEGWSVAVGIVVALEAGEKVVEEYRLDALAVSTRAYAAEMLFRDSKETRVEFTLEEARDPVKAIEARLKELARRRKSVDGRRKESQIWRHRLEHFTKVHGLDRAQMEELYASVDGTLDTVLPEQKELLDVAKKHLMEVQKYFKEPEGRQFVTEMIALSTSAYMRGVAADFAELSRRIGELRAQTASAPETEAPQSPAQKQIGWEELEELRERDQVENPGHWKGAPQPAATPAPPWILPY